MAELVTGFDIGGAHLKAAQVTAGGRVVAALQVPCALWQGLDRLEQAFAEVRTRLFPIGRTAITMTGELADLFPDRATGVRELVHAAEAALPEAGHRFWAGRHGFVGSHVAAGHAVEIASANWLASATFAARSLGEGLLVDLGSTTTDILLLAGGEVRARGFTDRERLTTGELVYTGLTRTPLMAVADRAPFAGRWVGMMKEYFATAADAYRVLGILPEAADQHPTADGGPKTAAASMRRLARMIGADAADGTPEDWRRLAAWLAGRQMRAIEDAAALQLSRGLVSDPAPLVGAGCGRFLLRPLAERLGLPYRDFAELLDLAPEARDWAATCAPAVAVALLALQELERAG
ncbi:hydantoinase/oxoprolinase family protein [Benzoatithermus flavus]|uniref:Hydantoinase/oxoprolinase family protein n=1 Tax=Benzoatithermus flavus TaxID=3108223 RepID=A0ABU8XPZ6_9PROT